VGYENRPSSKVTFYVNRATVLEGYDDTLVAAQDFFRSLDKPRNYEDAALVTKLLGEKFSTLNSEV